MQRGIQQRASRRSSAFTLLEVLVAAVVLTIGVVGMSGAMLSSLALQRSEAESTVARQAARQAAEQLQSVAFADVFRAYNLDPNDDPTGPGAVAPGPNFAVAGLNPAEGDVDGLCGRVMFPTVVVGGVEQLREDVVDPGLGMPQDLDASGAIDNVDHKASFSILPVRIRVEWRGVGGTEHFDLETILCRR